MFFQDGGQSFGGFAERFGGTGEQPSDRVLDHDGTVEHLGDPVRQGLYRGISPGALKQGAARAVGPKQQAVVRGEDGEEFS
ncbi:MAG: hypothetical protein H0U02_13340 [Rubrobacter sp.]|nr:hypothetical protein [Rubrobacter sp.]